MDCIFCQIVAGTREAEIIHQDEIIVVFRDKFPHAPVHLLIVPRKHIRSVNDLAEEDGPVIAHMFMKAPDLAKAEGVDRSGYRLQINVERGAGQVIFHLHMHLTGGWHR